MKLNKKFFIITALATAALTIGLLSSCQEAPAAPTPEPSITLETGTPEHNHVMSNWITDTEATCIAEGSKHIQCTICNEILLNDVIAKTSHNEGEWSTDKKATCTEDGSRHTECSLCKQTLRTESINKKGHTSSGWIISTAATNKVNGLKFKKCSDCNVLLETETIPATGPMGDTELAAYVEERTVAIVINGSINGTGFFIDENGTLVTNFHVIDDLFYTSSTPSIEISLKSQARYSVEYFVKFDPAYDLVVLKIDTKGQKVPYFEVVKETQPNNTKVYACGYALAFDTTNFTSGNISTTNHTHGLADAYIQSAHISGGNSGGPLVNGYGEVLAVNTASFVYGQNMNIALKLSNLDKLRFKGNKTLDDLLEWHSFETRDSLVLWLLDDDSYLSTYFMRSYIHTFQDITGRSCYYSSNTYGAFSGVNGYNSQYYYYYYIYNRDQYLEYIDYIKSEGYTRLSEYSGDLSADIYCDLYKSEVDGSYIEFITFTNPQSGYRMLQINAYIPA